LDGKLIKGLALVGHIFGRRKFSFDWDSTEFCNLQSDPRLLQLLALAPAPATLSTVGGGGVWFVYETSPVPNYTELTLFHNSKKGIGSVLILVPEDMVLLRNNSTKSKFAECYPYESLRLIHHALALPRTL
jgi:hypothetical protein